MKTTLGLLGLVMLVATFVSCGTGVDKREGADDKLILNNGEKWEVNAATNQGIENMIVLVNDFTTTDSSETFLQLKTDLEQEFKTIFEKCDMTGPAHDQLHNYLLPLKRYFNRLAAETSEERQVALAELKTHLESFPNYFK